MMEKSKFNFQCSILFRMCFSVLIFFLVFAPSAAAQISSGGSFVLEKSVKSGGGGESAGGAFTVAGTSGQNAAGMLIPNGQLDLRSGFWTPDQLAPTSALVSISGKVTTIKGSGIRNVLVTLTDLNGTVRTTFTGSLGTYSFSDVEVGQTYVLTIQAKKFFFSNTMQIVTVYEELTGIDFTAED